MSRRRLVRWLLGATAAFLVLTTLVHIPAVQHVMGWTTPDGEGACPFGYGPQGPRFAGAQPIFAPSASARPALDWSLTATSKYQIRAWALSNAVSCTPRQGGRTLECLDVPAGLLRDGIDMAVTTAWFELDGNGNVRAVRTVRRTTDPAAATRGFDALARGLERRLGAPTMQTGSSAASDLAAGALRQAAIEFLRDDYVATVRVTNMGDGFAITESYAARAIRSASASSS